jgi:hypothetical protein
MYIVDLILALKGIYLFVATHVIVQMACQAAQLSLTIPCSSVVSVRSDYWHFLCASARTVLLHIFIMLSVKILILLNYSNITSGRGIEKKESLVSKLPHIAIICARH